MASPRCYLGCLAAGLIGGLAVCAISNVVVNPYFVFNGPVIPGLNARHPYANAQMVIARTHLIARVQPRTLLLGNSRVEAGFDPAAPQWPEQMTPVFNGGLPGMGLGATQRLVEAALAGGRLGHLIIAAEFLDTLSGDADAPMPAIRRPVPPLDYWQEQLHDGLVASLTLGAASNSFMTVMSQRWQGINITRPDGSSELGEYAAFIRRVGGAALFDHKLDEYRAGFARYRAPVFAVPVRNATIGAIMALLEAARAAGVTADIIIYPYHASVLDLLNQHGLWPGFETFKRILVDVASSHYPAARIIDFSGYNQFTTEARPPDRPSAAMRWYWEPGHFRTSLGDRMIDRLFGAGVEFGIQLRPDSIDAALAAMRAERDAWHARQQARN